MKKSALSFILLSVSVFAQVPAPQIRLSLNIGPGGNFPFFNSGTIVMPSDANYTMVYPDTSAHIIRITTATGVSLSATRNIIAPQTSPSGFGFEFIIENVTAGGQAIQVIGTGTGVTIPNGQAMMVISDGINYISVGGVGGPGAGNIVGNTGIGVKLVGSTTNLTGTMIDAISDCGLVGDGVADDSAALQACINKYPGRKILLRHTAGPCTPPADCSPPVNYYMGTTTIILKGAGTQLVGEGNGKYSGGGTALYWAPNTTGIIMDLQCTSCEISNLYISGPDNLGQPKTHPFPSQCWEGTSVTSGNFGAWPGIVVSGSSQIIRDTTVGCFNGNGIHVRSANTCTAQTPYPCMGGTGLPQAQPDLWTIEMDYIGGNRGQGIVIEGSDSNVGTTKGVNSFGNELWGILDHNSFGSAHISPHTNGNGRQAISQGGINHKEAYWIQRKSNVVTGCFVGSLLPTPAPPPGFAVGNQISLAFAADPSFNSGSTPFTITAMSPSTPGVQCSIPGVTGSSTYGGWAQWNQTGPDTQVYTFGPSIGVVSNISSIARTGGTVTVSAIANSTTKTPTDIVTGLWVKIVGTGNAAFDNHVFRATSVTPGTGNAVTFSFPLTGPNITAITNTGYVYGADNADVYDPAQTIRSVFDGAMIAGSTYVTSETGQFDFNLGPPFSTTLPNPYKCGLTNNIGCGAPITIHGAGPGGADLVTYVVGVDYTTRLHVNTAASTSVTNAQVDISGTWTGGAYWSAAAVWINPYMEYTQSPKPLGFTGNTIALGGNINTFPAIPGSANNLANLGFNDPWNGLPTSIEGTTLQNINQIVSFADDPSGLTIRGGLTKNQNQTIQIQAWDGSAASASGTSHQVAFASTVPGSFSMADNQISFLGGNMSLRSLPTNPTTTPIIFLGGTAQNAAGTVLGQTLEYLGECPQQPVPYYYGNLTWSIAPTTGNMALSNPCLATATNGLHSSPQFQMSGSFWSPTGGTTGTGGPINVTWGWQNNMTANTTTGKLLKSQMRVAPVGPDVTSPVPLYTLSTPALNLDSQPFASLASWITNNNGLVTGTQVLCTNCAPSVVGACSTANPSACVCIAGGANSNMIATYENFMGNGLNWYCNGGGGGSTTGNGNVSAVGTPATHSTAVWQSPTSISGVGPGATGQVWTSNGPSFDPSWQPSGGIDYTKHTAWAGGTIVDTAPSWPALIGNGGSSIAPMWIAEQTHPNSATGYTGLAVAYDFINTSGSMQAAYGMYVDPTMNVGSTSAMNLFGAGISVEEYTNRVTTGGPSSLTAIGANCNHNGADHLSLCKGIDLGVYSTGTGPVDEATAARYGVISGAGSGTITVANGSKTDAQDIEGTITTYHQNYATANIAATGRITNYYGGYLSAPSIVTGGVISNTYGWVSEPGAGNFGINTTTPTHALEVVGTTQTGALIITGTSARSTGQELIVNGTGNFTNLNVTGTCTGCGGGTGTGAVNSVFGRTGTVVAANGDYSVAQVTGAAPLASPTFTGQTVFPGGTLTAPGISFTGVPNYGLYYSAAQINTQINGTSVLGVGSGGLGVVGGMRSYVNTALLTVQGGGDAGANFTSGSLLLRGGNCTTGAWTCISGNSTLQGGDNGTTNATQIAGDLTIRPGQVTGTGPTSMQNGRLFFTVVGVKGATATVGTAGCISASAPIAGKPPTYSTCTVTSNIPYVGPIQNNNGSSAAIQIDGDAQFNSSAAAQWTTGQFICLDTTNAGYFTNSSSPCSTGAGAGIVSFTDASAVSTHYGTISSGKTPSSAGGGLGDPGANGIIKRTALNTTAVAVAADYPILNQNTTGTAAGITSNGTANQVWAMNSGATAQGWVTPSATGSTSWSSLTAPTSQLSIAMGANTSTFLTNSGTGVGLPDWLWQDSSSGVTTAGSFLKVQTNATSTLENPLMVTSGPTNGLIISGGTGNITANGTAKFVGPHQLTGVSAASPLVTDASGNIGPGTVTATGLTTNGTANQVWAMNAGATAQGWTTPTGGGMVWPPSSTVGIPSISGATTWAANNYNASNQIPSNYVNPVKGFHTAFGAGMLIDKPPSWITGAPAPTMPTVMNIGQNITGNLTQQYNSTLSLQTTFTNNTTTNQAALYDFNGTPQIGAGSVGFAQLTGVYEAVTDYSTGSNQNNIYGGYITAGTPNVTNKPNVGEVGGLAVSASPLHTGTTIDAFGLKGGVQLSEATLTTQPGSLPNAYNIWADGPVQGTVGNVFGFYSSERIVGGTTTNYYANYVKAPVINGGVLTNKYAFVSEPNSGPVGIATITPTHDLEVNGTTQTSNLIVTGTCTGCGGSSSNVVYSTPVTGTMGSTASTALSTTTMVTPTTITKYRVELQVKQTNASGASCTTYPSMAVRVQYTDADTNTSIAMNQGGAYFLLNNGGTAPTQYLTFTVSAPGQGNSWYSIPMGFTVAANQPIQLIVWQQAAGASCTVTPTYTVRPYLYAE